MKWLNELCGIPVNSTLNVSIPKEKLVADEQEAEEYVDKSKFGL